MKVINIKNITRLIVFGLLFVKTNGNLCAQTPNGTITSLSLQEVIRQAKESNKLTGALRTGESAALLDVRDARISALPRVLSYASYQRYSDITIYDGVLGESHKIPKPPNANAGSLGLEAHMHLFSGGRHRSVVADLEHKRDLASISVREQEATVALQAALQYLDMIRLYFQQQLIKDQTARAKERSKNIEALHANGKVTKSDMLRADVLLSNALLTAIANANDYRISNQKLNMLLNLDAFTKVIPADTASLTLADSLELQALQDDYSGTYALLKLQKNVELQENRTRMVRSSTMPSAAFVAGYGFNYPNTFVLPPPAQTIAVGLVGIKLNYDLSSVYQNHYKIKSSRLKETEIRQQKEWIADNVRQEAEALVIKYKEALNRMDVIQKSIEQAETNYQIQNTKYFNQLGLLTDLLEADNLYQESKFNYIQANIAALSIHYRLLFISGKL